VSPQEAASEARAAFDPATGRPVVLWVGSPGGQGYALRMATTSG
jgi:hypothetical protein